ncbi:MAG TPA: hypothetical protein PLY70_10195 [Saprospiraceae bacterium]|nr:hypothetical protein [Saprospiraceae bacterium]HPN69573.1 hypothetical protein [Saprospiraceae bacterium]
MKNVIPRKEISNGILLFIIPISILIILRLLGFDGMAGQDGYAYVDYAKNIRTWFDGGAHPGSFFWPPGYPLFGALLSYLGISIPLSMQLVSCLSLSGVLFYVLKFKTEQNKREEVKYDNRIVFSYLLIFGVFAPYFLRAGMVTSSDMFASFWVTFSAYYFYDYSQKYRFLSLTLGVLGLCLGVLARYPVIVALLPLALYAIYVWIKSVRKVSHLSVLILPVVVYFIHDLFKGGDVAFLNHHGITKWSWTNAFANSFQTNDGITNHTIPNIIFIFSPFFHLGFMFLGFVFVYKLFQDKKIWLPIYLLIISSYLTYALFLAGIPDQNARLLLILYPFVLMLCFYGYAHFSKRALVMKYKFWILISLVIFQALLFGRAMLPSIKRMTLEKRIAERLNNEYTIVSSEKDSTILYSFDIDIAIKSRGIPFKSINLFKEVITTFNAGDYVLFNEDKLKLQWQGLNPMINWEFLKKNQELTLVSDFGDGWRLYLIGERVTSKK